MIYQAYCFSLKRGFFKFYFTGETLKKVKKYNWLILFKAKVHLSLNEQKELFQYLYLYYKEGSNIYYIIENYKNVINKSKKQLIKRVLALLKKGNGFTDILLSGSLLGSSSRIYLFIAKETGSMETAIREIYEMVSNKIVENKKIFSKAFYPLLLFLLVILLIPIFSAIIVPQISSYYKYYQLKSPFILTLFQPRNLLIANIFILFIGTLSFVLFKQNYSIIARLPLLKNIMNKQFQKSLFIIYLASIKYNLSFDYLIDRYIEAQNSYYESYLLSTLSLLIKQGKSTVETMDSMAVMKKYKPIFSPQIENVKKIVIIEKMLKELNLNEQEYYDRLANLGVLFIMLIVGMLVFMFGYIMLSPLQQIINVI